VFAASGFEDYRLDALQMQKMGEHQAGRARSNDSDLRTHLCFRHISLDYSIAESAAVEI
jgi:hypothetical protein